MTDKQVIALQRWWLGELREITRKAMKAEEKRIEQARAKTAKILGDAEIEKREDIDELYAYGVISSKKRDRLLDMWDQANETENSLYEAKISLLQEAYTEAKNILRDHGQEV